MTPLSYTMPYDNMSYNKHYTPHANMQFQGEHIHIKKLYSPYEFVYPSEKIYVLKKVF